MKATYAFLSMAGGPARRSAVSLKGVDFLGNFGKVAGLELGRQVRSGELSIQIDEVDSARIGKKVSAMASKAAVFSFAPVVPMKLIAPISASTATPLATDGVTWGVKAVGANTSSCTGKGVVVAVLDTGIDKTHPAFSTVKLVEKDFTGEGNGDTVGHGTHCAGTIFGNDTNGTRIGVAIGIKTALIGKVIGKNGGTSDQILKAIQWAMDHGANVISMSLGIDFPGMVRQLLNENWPVELATSRALEGYRANVQLFERLASLIHAQEAFSQPAVLVAAAGNESQTDTNPDFKIAVGPPAVAEGITSVGALGQANNGLKIAPFSNTGANLCGPGVDIDSAAMGGGLTRLSGTSMATPHVAGVAALWAEWLAKQKSLKVARLAMQLTSSCDTKALEVGYDPNDVGFGLVRAPQN